MPKVPVKAKEEPQAVKTEAVVSPVKPEAYAVNVPGVQQKVGGGSGAAVGVISVSRTGVGRGADRGAMRPTGRKTTAGKGLPGRPAPAPGEASMVGVAAPGGTTGAMPLPAQGALAAPGPTPAAGVPMPVGAPGVLPTVTVDAQVVGTQGTFVADGTVVPVGVGVATPGLPGTGGKTLSGKGPAAQKARVIRKPSPKGAGKALTAAKTAVTGGVLAGVRAKPASPSADSGGNASSRTATEKRVLESGDMTSPLAKKAKLSKAKPAPARKKPAAAVNATAAAPAAPAAKAVRAPPARPDQLKNRPPGAGLPGAAVGAGAGVAVGAGGLTVAPGAAAGAAGAVAGAGATAAGAGGVAAGAGAGAGASAGTGAGAGSSTGTNAGANAGAGAGAAAGAAGSAAVAANAAPVKQRTRRVDEELNVVSGVIDIEAEENRLVSMGHTDDVIIVEDNAYSEKMLLGGARLRAKMQAMAKRFVLEEQVGTDIMEMMSLAVEERLRYLFELLKESASLRMEVEKSEWDCVPDGMNVFKKMEQMREEEERSLTTAAELRVKRRNDRIEAEAKKASGEVSNSDKKKDGSSVVTDAERKEKLALEKKRKENSSQRDALSGLLEGIYKRGKRGVSSSKGLAPLGAIGKVSGAKGVANLPPILKKDGLGKKGMQDKLGGLPKLGRDADKEKAKAKVKRVPLTLADMLFVMEREVVSRKTALVYKWTARGTLSQ